MLFFLKKQVFKCFFSSFLNSLISFEYTEVATINKPTANTLNVNFFKGNYMDLAGKKFEQKNNMVKYKYFTKIQQKKLILLGHLACFRLVIWLVFAWLFGFVFLRNIAIGLSITGRKKWGSNQH